MQTMKPSARRNFLLAATLGGAGVVAVAATAHLGPAVAAATPTEAAEKSGYRATPHILTYYNSTRF